MLRSIAVVCIATVLGGCAAFNSLSSEVSTYGPWPADRQPASFEFERLPSQQAQVQLQRQVQLETAARGALEAAGFRAVSAGGSADYLMQIGARVSTNDPWIYNDPLFWRGGLRYGHGYGDGRWGRGWNGGWGFNGGYDYVPSFDREVALLIRDRKTGQLLYEARANNAGPSAAIDYLLPAMFGAALKDFPSAGPNPRRVTTTISSP